MKILAFDRHASEEFDPPVGADLMPDCAIIKDGKPFFLPAFSENWAYYIAPVFRVCRLGKHIGRKFAMRYIDAFTVAVITRPVDALELYSGMPYGLFNSYEGAIILGEWIPLPADGHYPEATVQVGDLTVTMDSLPKDSKALDGIIEYVSGIATMKIGDIIATSRMKLCDNLPLDTLISADVGGEPILSVRIK